MTGLLMPLIPRSTSAVWQTRIRGPSRRPREMSWLIAQQGPAGEAQVDLRDLMTASGLILLGKLIYCHRAPAQAWLGIR